MIPIENVFTARKTVPNVETSQGNNYFLYGLKDQFEKVMKFQH